MTAKKEKDIKTDAAEEVAAEEFIQQNNTESQTKQEQEQPKAVESAGDVAGDEDEKDKRIAELEEELNRVKDNLLRKAAELENVRKRVQRERVQLFDDAKAAALEDFMPLSDDLARTLKAAEESKIESGFLEGIQMVNNKFEEILQKNGVSRIDKENVPFDIDLHDAILKQPAPDEKMGSNVVIQVLESGFKIGSRTVKHAKVIVSE